MQNTYGINPADINLPHQEPGFRDKHEFYSQNPEVGMGATINMWSDSHACTIIEVSRTKAGKLKSVKVQHDKAIRVDAHGMSDSQDHRYERNYGGAIEEFTLRQNGRWIPPGASMRRGTSLTIGCRREHYDYSF